MYDDDRDEGVNERRRSAVNIFAIYHPDFVPFVPFRVPPWPSWVPWCTSHYVNDWTPPSYHTTTKQASRDSPPPNGSHPKIVLRMMITYYQNNIF